MIIIAHLSRHPKYTVWIGHTLRSGSSCAEAETANLSGSSIFALFSCVHLLLINLFSMQCSSVPMPPMSTRLRSFAPAQLFSLWLAIRKPCIGTTMKHFNDELAHPDGGEKRAFHMDNICCDHPMESSHQPTLHPFGHGEWNSVGSSLPPLDQVTVCSTVDDNDSSTSSVSSMSSDNEFRREEKPRSIFREYWKQSEGRILKDVSNSKEPFPSMQDSCANTYDCSLELHTQNVAKVDLSPRSRSPRSRRRIFGKVALSESAPTLSLYLFPRNSVQKAKSESFLSHAKKPKRSCLRQTRFCGKERRNSDSSEVSVSFSPKIEVVLFQRPCEQWAADGWSNWFA
jgi:hypothetical protein